MGKVMVIAATFVMLTGCGAGRELACQCEGTDVLEGPHPADEDYGTCAESRLTCWVTANETKEECTEADEATEQEAVCCAGEDCACSCTDEGPAAN